MAPLKWIFPSSGLKKNYRKFLHRFSEMNQEKTNSKATSLAPWLSVRNSARALLFYKTAFQAEELLVMQEDLDGPLVARLSINGAEFWISEESPEHGNFSPESLKGSSVRMILTVSNPDPVFQRALAEGAILVSEMAEEHGWRTGRLLDPFGHHWEIGCEIS
jgi:PhnB protein